MVNSFLIICLFFFSLAVKYLEENVMDLLEPYLFFISHIHRTSGSEIKTEH